ncbi:MAG: hypothetical protein IPJ98_05650 [Bryobacterales bacterium]|nr:hypothetical protein [Bryobacterales bacterium]
MITERLSDGVIELDVTRDFGPRIIRFGFVGGQNHMLTIPDELQTDATPAPDTPDTTFHCRGGHRLWVAPELVPGTYYPDNHPVDITRTDRTLTATAPTETTGLQKQLHIELEGDARVRITHTLWNRSAWPVEVSIWALTMMAPGGLGITGFPPRGTHPEMLPPTNPLIMWAFSDFTDPRLTLTRRFLALQQNPAIQHPNKFGLWNPHTWGAYLLHNELFLKQTTALPNTHYPDHGASFEIWVNGTTLELETLSPLHTLHPGASITHTEHWSLHRPAPLASLTDDSLARLLATTGPTL